MYTKTTKYTSTFQSNNCTSQELVQAYTINTLNEPLYYLDRLRFGMYSPLSSLSTTQLALLGAITERPATISQNPVSGLFYSWVVGVPTSSTKFREEDLQAVLI